MSVWKKASKANQKTHRERHQPEERRHLGLLEKKKDYVTRAQDFNNKKATLKLLKKKTLNKNPDEFYHHMINSKIDNGVHHEKETEEEDTPEQIQLMCSQDLKYIISKRTQEFKRIERLQSQLHLLGLDHKVKNKHIYFKNNMEDYNTENTNYKRLEETKLPDIDINALSRGSRTRTNIYNELSKRIHRERELSVIQQKIETKRYLEGKKSILPPKKVKRGTKDAPPVYVWKYERKR